MDVDEAIPDWCRALLAPQESRKTTPAPAADRFGVIAEVGFEGLRTRSVAR
jgi:hypothetical protein